MMMGSREAVVDYMTPLGLAAPHGHRASLRPGPWVNDLNRADWNPTYYHRADANGIGFDRGPEGQQRHRAVLAEGRDAVSPIRRRCPSNSCCGSITCPGITGWPRAARCGTRWCSATRAASKQWGRCARTWADARSRLRRRRAIRAGRGVPRHPGAGGAVVARCLHRVFPERYQAAAAGRGRAARATARVLQVAEVSVRARARLSEC